MVKGRFLIFLLIFLLIPLVSGALVNDVVFVYQFEEGSGSHASSSVGGNGLNLINDPLWNGTFKQFGNYSIEMDREDAGSIDYATNLSADFGNSFSTGDKSYNIWFRKNTEHSTRLIGIDDGTDNSGSVFGITHGGTEWTVVGWATEDWNTGVAGSFYNATEMHMITVTYIHANTSTRLYTDGVLNASINTKTYNASYSAIYLGKEETFGTVHTFDGKMDEVTLFNKSLNQSEIDELWNGGVGLAYPYTVPEPVLIVNLITPVENETISQPYNINFNISDPASRDWSVSLLLFQDGVLNYTLVDTLSQDDISYYWSSPVVSSGVYNLTLSACLTNESNTTFLGDNNLVLYTAFEEGLGNVTDDESVNDYTVDIIGNSWAWNDSKGGNGTRNFSLSFDANDYLRTQEDDDSFVGTNLTIVAWILRNDLSNNGMVVAKRGSSEKNFQVGVDDPTNKPVFETYSSCGGSSTDLLGDTVLSEGEWTFIVWNMNWGINKSIYVNNVFDGSSVSVTTIPGGCSNQQISIGVNLGNPGNTDFRGNVDNVMIFNRTLSQEEMTDIYNSGVSFSDSVIINCTNDTAKINVENPPNVSIVSPVNNSLSNEIPLVFSFNTSEGGYCELLWNESAEVLDFNSSVLANLNSLLEWNGSYSTEGTFDFLIRCNDSFDVWGNDSVIVRYDTVEPKITVYNPNASNNSIFNYDFFYNISCLDSNLFNFEINVTNSSFDTVFYEYLVNLTGKYLNYSNQSNATSHPDGVYNVSVWCGDDHHFYFSKGQGDLKANPKGLNVNFTRGDKELFVLEVKSSDISLSNVSIVKYKDGFKIGYDRVSKPVNSSKTTFVISSNYDVFVRDLSIAHFVVGDVAVDFKAEVESGAKVKTRFKKGKWLVDVMSKNKIIDPFISNLNNASAFFSFVVDTTAPVVSLVGPSNDSYLKASQVSFVFNVSDFTSVQNCSIILDDRVNDTLFSVERDVDQSFIVANLSDGLHSWGVNCSDSAGNVGVSVFYVLNFSFLADPEVNCYYSSMPFFANRIDWLCYLNDPFYFNSFECNSYVGIEGVTIQTNPVRKEIDMFGVVDTFSEENGLVNVYFRRDNVRQGQNYSFIIKCASDNYVISFEADVFPQYAFLFFGVDRLVWAGGNAGYIVGSVLAVIILVLAFWLIRKIFTGAK